MVLTETQTTGERREILTHLYELIAASDRRVPRLERIGEARIAREATELRERAVSLAQRIESEVSARR